MAYGNVFKDAFGKVKNKLEGFLYREEAGVSAPTPSMNEEPSAAQPQQEAYQQPAQMAGGAYYPYAQQTPYQAQAPYAQQPYQQPYQQPQQAFQPQPAATQAPEQPYQRVFQTPLQQAGAYIRNRRADRTPVQPENNVVDFAAYQQQGQQEAPSAAAVSAPPNARIINARGMGDCRGAITLLRNGDSVLIVLENITDPAEMRRLVDTLSGACYSLTATITKVSRSGVYLLAPQSMAVYADQTTNQMNMAPARAAAAARAAQAGYAAPQQPQPRPAYQQPAYQQPAYQQPAYQQPYPAYAPQQPFTAPQSAFTQRSAAPEEAGQPFYNRQPVQGAQIPAFATQQAGYGYAPDETAAAEQ